MAPRRSTAAAGPAKPRSEDNLGKPRGDHRWFAPVVAELRQVFPRLKIAREIAALANCSDRVVEDWLASPPRGAPAGRVLAELLNSRIGDRVWQALTKNCDQPWRKKLNRQMEISRLLDMQAEVAAQLAALQRGDA